MADKGIYMIITTAAMLLRFDTTHGPRLINCWLPAETWVEALKKTGRVDASLNIDTQKFNAAFVHIRWIKHYWRGPREVPPSTVLLLH
jgi:hypothetical protein